MRKNAVAIPVNKFGDDSNVGISIERIAFGKEESGIGKTTNSVTTLIRAFFNPAPFIENPLINFYGRCLSCHTHN